MAFDFAINQDGNFLSELTSPSEFALQSQGKDFPVEGLGDREAELLTEQLNTLIATFDSEMVTQFINQRQEAIARTASFAKTQFDEKLFGGINAADNEIGLSMLRPGQIRASTGNDGSHPGTSAGDVINDWYFTPNSSGAFEDWIGTSGNPYTINEDEVVLVLGFIEDSQQPSEFSAINVQSFGRNVDMLPLDVNDARIMDNETGQQIVPMPSLIGQDQDSVHIRAYPDRQVERQPRLLGFTFGLGSFLNTESYT